MNLVLIRSDIAMYWILEKYTPPQSLTRLFITVEVGFRQNVIMVLMGLVALTIFLTVAALVFKIWEREWTFLDAFYFSFVTMTTVGFGDMVPSERFASIARTNPNPNSTLPMPRHTCYE